MSSSRGLPALLPVLGYLAPYKIRLAGASLALLFTAAATLSLGLGVQVLIDRGFGGGTSADLKAAIALLVASSMGGIQALSRSYFSKLIPPENSAEFFGFYNVFGKFAAIAGPALLGIVGRMTGDTRWGVLSILVLFVIGAWLLMKVRD